MKDDSTSKTNTGDDWRADAQGHRRYRGKTATGRMSRAQNDELDFAQCMRSVCTARDLYAAADALLDPRERREARADAKAQLMLAMRFIDELAKRRR